MILNYWCLNVLQNCINLGQRISYFNSSISVSCFIIRQVTCTMNAQRVCNHYAYMLFQCIIFIPVYLHLHKHTLHIMN